MNGTIKVPLDVTRVGSGATVKWAEVVPPDGDVFDIQVLRPGTRMFVPWLTDQTSARFDSSDGAYTYGGVYKFRARFENTVAGAMSGYSNPASVSIP